MEIDVNDVNYYRTINLEPLTQTMYGRITMLKSEGATHNTDKKIIARLAPIFSMDIETIEAN